MSRDDGFDVADVDTNLYDDTKTKALWRALGDVQRMTAAMTLYTATLLASWRHGCRVTVAEAVPIWLEPDATLLEELRRAKLLDKLNKLPVHSWRSWFDPAYERREVRRAAGRRGGLASGQARSKQPLKQPLTVAEPDRPSGRSVLPSDRPSVPSRARGTTRKSAERDDYGELVAATMARQLGFKEPT